MDNKEVLETSKRAYGMWKNLWRKNSSMTRTFTKIPMDIIRNKGLGKTAVLIGLSPCLEDNIEILKQYQDKVDILCIDKAFPVLMENGIIPDIVLVADARVSYEVYCEPFINQTKNIMLVANVNSNYKWGKNWRGPKTYYVNKDNINSEVEFSAISGINDLIPASSNVSNALLVYAHTVLKYDKYILVGYGYSWKPGGKFYAFAHGNEKSSLKSYYLNQLRVPDQNGDLVNTSENLWFSKRWVENYIGRVIGFDKVANASEGILKLPVTCKLNQLLESKKLYQRQLNQTEYPLVFSKKIKVVDPQSYAAVKSIITDDKMMVTNLNIEFYNKEDEKYAAERESKHSVQG